MSPNAPLLSFIDQLRGKGVRTFKGQFGEGVVEIELGPALIPDAPPESGTRENPANCKCGCLVAAHTNGLCVGAGCDPEKCNPEAT